jgi:hypothetical protein
LRRGHGEADLGGVEAESGLQKRPESAQTLHEKAPADLSRRRHRQDEPAIDAGSGIGRILRHE